MTITAWLRWAIVEQLLPNQARRVLDIGAGTGSIGSLLADRFEYVGIEPDKHSFDIATRRIGARGELLNCGFEDLEPEQDFDVVCALEVLEHIDDDDAAVTRWVRHLRPGGCLLISVPSDPGRYGQVNASVGDLRRYDPEDLVRLFAGAALGQIVVRAYGSPYANVQETIQNVVSRGRRYESPVCERTAKSGRHLQPPVSLARVVHAVATPLERLQRPFSARGIGTGLVARGEFANRGPGRSQREGSADALTRVPASFEFDDDAL